MYWGIWEPAAGTLARDEGAALSHIGGGAMVDVTENWPLSLLRSPKRQPVPAEEPAYGATAAQPTSPHFENSHRSLTESLSDSVHETWDRAIFPNLPKTVDNILCCLGLSLTLITLLSVEAWTGFRLYSLSMSASGVRSFARMPVCRRRAPRSRCGSRAPRAGVTPSCRFRGWW